MLNWARRGEASEPPQQVQSLARRGEVDGPRPIAPIPIDTPTQFCRKKWLSSLEAAGRAFPPHWNSTEEGHGLGHCNMHGGAGFDATTREGSVSLHENSSATRTRQGENALYQAPA